MCAIFEKDLEKILQVLITYVSKNRFNIVEDDLKDYLADLKDANEIIACGCDGFFEVKTEEKSVIVNMEILSGIRQFIIDDNPRYQFKTFSEVIPNYDDLIENDSVV